jgi:hypothetical protein
LLSQKVRIIKACQGASREPLHLLFYLNCISA